MAASINIQSVDDIRASFPHPDIPVIKGEPTYKSIKSLHDILKGNASSIPSTLGGGGHGLLGLVMNPVLYTAITTHNFVLPANPLFNLFESHVS